MPLHDAGAVYESTHCCAVWRVWRQCCACLHLPNQSPRVGTAGAA